MRWEVGELATWMYSSLNPGKEMAKPEKMAQAKEIMNRCDINGDGVLDAQEFLAYYESVIGQIDEAAAAARVKVEEDAETIQAAAKAAEARNEVALLEHTQMTESAEKVQGVMKAAEARKEVAALHAAEE